MIEDFSSAATYGTGEQIASLITVVCMLIFAFYHRKAKKELKVMKRNILTALRGKTMNRKEFEEIQNRAIGDALFESLCNLLDEGKITRNKLDKTLRQLAAAMYIPDFLPVNKSEVAAYLTREEYGYLMSIIRSKKHMRLLLSRGKKVPLVGEFPEVIHQTAQQVLDTNLRAKQLAWNGLDEDEHRRMVEKSHIVPDEAKTVKQSFGIKKVKTKGTTFGGKLLRATA